MMKLSREERLGLALAVENSDQELQLNDTDRKLLRKISRYIQTFSLNEYEIEEIRKELIGISAQAEMRGESLSQAIGMEYTTFCNEMITALTEREIPVKYKWLKITGTLLILGGIYQLIIAVLALYIFISMCSWGREFVTAYYLRSWIYICYLLVMTVMTGVSALYGGVKGRMKCGDAKAAGQCFKCGIVLLILHGGAFMWDIITAIVWQTRGLMPFIEILYLCFILVIFTTLLLYTSAARQNMKSTIKETGARFDKNTPLI